MTLDEARAVLAKLGFGTEAAEALLTIAEEGARRSHRPPLFPGWRYCGRCGGYGRDPERPGYGCERCLGSCVERIPG